MMFAGDGLRRNGLAQVVYDELSEIASLDGIIPFESRGKGGVLVKAVAASSNVLRARPSDAHRKGFPLINARVRRWVIASLVVVEDEIDFDLPNAVTSA